MTTASTMLLRSVPLALKRASEPEGIVAGYASTFGNVDLFGDVVAPGAFKESLAAHAAERTSPAMLWAHDGREPIGRWERLEEDAKGLRVHGQLTMDSARGGDAYALARDGALALSIGFVTQASKAGPNGTRILTKIDLWEISLVAMPANIQARIIGVKAALAPDTPITARLVEQALRDAGLPRSAAKAIAAEGMKALPRQRDVEAEAVPDMVSAIQALTDRINTVTKGL